MQEPRLEVIGLGAMNLDRFYSVGRILADGEGEVLATTTAPGGSAANTVFALARLGVSCGFVGAVGRDLEGVTLVRDLERAGVDTSRIRVKARDATGAVICLTDREGRRSLYVSPGANRLLGWRDLDLAYLGQARFLHLSSFVHRRQLHLQTRLAQELPQTALSLSLGALYAALGLRALRPLLARTRLLFLNQEELQQLTDQDLPQGAARLRAEGCHTVVVTLGAGARRYGRRTAAYIDSQDGQCLVEVSEGAPNLVDATGAGDAFAAGFLLGQLKGMSLLECGCLGDLVAQRAISSLGARGGLPTRDELAPLYREAYGENLRL
ncbi:MAG: carbohydrate kinase family protein [Chloroflexi bacterium]|nr:carbohydrate kinase family protein [Chloroflexota bacterium]